MKRLPAIRELVSIPRRLLKRWVFGERDPDYFLPQSRGVIHIGANIGQERDLYDQHNLRVVWIEALPDVCRELQERIAGYPRQSAFCSLITDQDDKKCDFQVSNNNGLSSSVLELAEHRKLWPDVCVSETLVLKSVTLPSLVRRERIDLNEFDALVLDVQGAEMLVLRGATEVLSNFRFIKAEVADFEAYQGCCRFEDLDRFLRERSFRLTAKQVFHQARGVGRYFDVTYRLRTGGKRCA